MKPISEIRIIDKEEAGILYKALHEWYIHQKRIPQLKDSGELLKVDQLYRDLKYFLQEEE